MDSKTAHKLNELTSEFYRRSADSFSASRVAPWSGWERCVGYLRDLAVDGHSSVDHAMQILDLGCGNLRFENYLAESLHADYEVWAIDNCLELVGDSSLVLFQELDIVSALVEEADINALVEAPQCDAVCAFGFFHHIPGAKARRQLLASMLEHTVPGGLVMIALWQFAESERMKRKAVKATDRALGRFPNLELDDGDYLLGWQEEQDVFRYCHSFSDGEVGGLIGFAKLRGGHLIDNFSSDGKTDDLNRYLVFKKD